MTKIVTLKRDVRQLECPWLDRDLKTGESFWTYSGCQYGVIGPGGIAVTAKAAETPFFEIPEDSVG